MDEAIKAGIVGALGAAVLGILVFGGWFAWREYRWLQRQKQVADEMRKRGPRMNPDESQVTSLKEIKRRNRT